MSGSRLRVEAIGVTGIGEVCDGDDLATLIVRALDDAGEQLRDGDLLVVSSKVVSKAEGRTLTATGRDTAIDTETVRVVAERATPRGTTRVVQSRSGPVLAAAGVDASNVSPGTILLLPRDPDASARTLRARLRQLSGTLIGVLISDTVGRPWRDGQIDLAIGAAGVAVTDDLRGATDPYGNPLEVTVRAVADELAAAADLVKGKLDGVPAALLRGLPGLVTEPDGPGAAALLRTGPGDWFRLGHVEAVRSALGAPPGTKGVAPASVTTESAAVRLRRALDVATAGPDLIERADRVRPWLTTVVSPEFTPSMARLMGPAAPASPNQPPGTGPGADGSVGPGGGPVAATAADRVQNRGTGDVALAVVLPGGPSAPASAVQTPPSLADALTLGAFAQRVIAAAWAEDLQVRASVRPDGALILVAAARR